MNATALAEFLWMMKQSRSRHFEQDATALAPQAHRFFFTIMKELIFIFEGSSTDSTVYCNDEQP
jgi:hypothetical protein